MFRIHKFCSSLENLTSARIVLKQASRKKSEATFDIRPADLHKLDTGPATSVTLTRDDALSMYKDLVFARRIEAVSNKLYKAKHIRGFCHLYTGQEAVAVGMLKALRKHDSLITAYRCHVFAAMMGVGALGLMAEMTGRVTGCSRGKGGSLHMYAPRFYGGNGIVGAQAPLGAGIAFAHKYRGDGGVTFTLYGDGAANQGQICEATNMAHLLNIPVIFVCENNGYGMGTSIKRSSASTNYYTRGDYVPGLKVDGMDTLATREATRFCCEYCSSGKGPLMMEMETYRYHGHSMSDPGTSYRSRDEVQEVRKTKDPIQNFKSKILDSGLVKDDEVKTIDKEMAKYCDEVGDKSLTEPEPDVKELTADVYYKNLGGKIWGIYPGLKYDHLEIAPRNLK